MTALLTLAWAFTCSSASTRRRWVRRSARFGDVVGHRVDLVTDLVVCLRGCKPAHAGDVSVIRSCHSLLTPKRKKGRGLSKIPIFHQTEPFWAAKKCSQGFLMSPGTLGLVLGPLPWYFCKLSEIWENHVEKYVVVPSREVTRVVLVVIPYSFTLP